MNNLDRLHVTPSSEKRIRRNMSLEDDVDVVLWCRDKIASGNTKLLKKGRNMYVYTDEYIFTIGYESYTIITVHEQLYS